VRAKSASYGPFMNNPNTSIEETKAPVYSYGTEKEKKKGKKHFLSCESEIISAHCYICILDARLPQLNR
jgi:hypothetical protein